MFSRGTSNKYPLVGHLTIKLMMAFLIREDWTLFLFLLDFCSSGTKMEHPGLFYTELLEGFALCTRRASLISDLQELKIPFPR